MEVSTRQCSSGPAAPPFYRLQGAHAARRGGVSTPEAVTSTILAMDVLVTGGTGYIGSHTVVELLQAGHEPVIVDNLANSKRSVIDRIEELTGYRPVLHEIDIGDRVALDPIIGTGRFGAVLHFAGLKAVGESVRRPLDYYRTNVGGSTALLEVMAHHRLRTVVFSSSATVYGAPETVPVVETMPTAQPTNPYGRSKLIIEGMLEDVHAADPDWNVGILRYFNPAGAHESGVIGEDPNGIPNNLMPFITQVAAERLPELLVFGDDYPTRDGTGIRDYIHVVDLARGHVAALERMEADPGFHVWNLGTGQGHSVLEVKAAFERSTGVRVPHRVVDRRPGDIAAIWADPSRAQRELAWNASRSVDDMCVDAWRWQQFAQELSESE